MANNGTLTITYRMKGDRESFRALVNDTNGLKAAMNGSIVKGSEMTRVLRGITDSARGASGNVGALQKVLNMSVGSLGKFAGGLGVAKVALEGAKRLMMATESNFDLFHSTLAQCTAACDGFFESIASGSFTQFLNGLDGVIDRARDAYEAIDELESFSIRYNPQARTLEKQIQALRTEANALRQQGKTDAAKATMEKVAKLEKQLDKLQMSRAKYAQSAGYKDLRDIYGKTGVEFTRDQMRWHADARNWEEEKRQAKMFESKNGQSYIDQYNRASKMGDNGVALSRISERIIKIFGSVDNLFKYQRSHVSQNVRDSDPEIGKRLGEAINNIQAVPDALADIQMRKARNDIASARIDKPGRVSNTSVTSKGEIRAEITPVISTDRIGQSQSDLAALIKEYQTQMSETTNQSEYNSLQAKVDELKSLLEYMQTKGLAEVSTAKMSKNMSESFAAQLKEDLAKSLEGFHLEMPVTLGKPDAEEMLQECKTAAGGIASALNSAASAMSSFGEESSSAAVAAKTMSIAASIAALVAQFAAIPKGNEIWSWIAGTVAGAGALVTTIAQIRSATAFANGGVVSGPTYALVGEYAGASNNPEVIAPLDKLKSFIGDNDNNGGGLVEFRIRDKELVGILDRRHNMNKRN